MASNASQFLLLFFNWWWYNNGLCTIRYINNPTDLLLSTETGTMTRTFSTTAAALASPGAAECFDFSEDQLRNCSQALQFFRNKLSSLQTIHHEFHILEVVFYFLFSILLLEIDSGHYQLLQKMNMFLVEEGWKKIMCVSKLCSIIYISVSSTSFLCAPKSFTQLDVAYLLRFL